jgi:hypothetical protein|tara:strand:+ start:110 stop:232 length:123 start_codon:yes stop_codon:yes gene_type:complete
MNNNNQKFKVEDIIPYIKKNKEMIIERVMMGIVILLIFFG